MSLNNLKENSRISKDIARLVNENETIIKKYIKLKGQYANLRINERKLISDNNALLSKIQSIAHENEELTQKLKELKRTNEIRSAERQLIPQKASLKPVTKRLGSDNHRLNSRFCKKKNVFEKKKYSEVCPSQRLKKVSSNQGLLPINGNPKLFARRETLDVINVNNRVMLGVNDDKSTRNSDLINMCTSDDERSIHRFASPQYGHMNESRNNLKLKSSINSSLDLINFSSQRKLQ